MKQKYLNVNLTRNYSAICLKIFLGCKSMGVEVCAGFGEFEGYLILILVVVKIDIFNLHFKPKDIDLI